MVEVKDLITMQEYEDALTRMKNGKSHGKDGISVEVIRDGREFLKAMMLNCLTVDGWRKR